MIAGLVAQARLNRTHEIVAELVKERFVDRVLTTNFDGLVLKACLRADVPIYDYDLSNMQGYDPGLVRSPAVCFLHGRDGGFLQFHTEPEMLSHASTLAPVIRDAVSHRPIVVVGDSGMEPVCNLLTERKQYAYGLFWVHYGDLIPGGRMLTELIMPNEGTYFVLAGGARTISSRSSPAILTYRFAQLLCSRR